MKKFMGTVHTSVREFSKLYRILNGILTIAVKILALNVVFMDTHFLLRKQFSINVFGAQKIILFAVGDDYLLRTIQ